MLHKKDIIEKNINLYNTIRQKIGVEKHSEVVEVLHQKGYDNYKDSQSIRNRFRSSAIGIDFFWHLLDSTDLKIEIVSNNEPKRNELIETIETLHDEIEMIKAIKHDAKIISLTRKLSDALLEFESAKKEIDAFFDSTALKKAFDASKEFNTLIK